MKPFVRGRRLDGEIKLGKKLDEVVIAIEKQFGKGSVLTSDKPIEPVSVISTGWPSLDLALGIGGLPRGRIVEIYGPAAAGKTTIALQTIAQGQKAGGLCAIIDVEQALDLQYAQNLGVDIDALIISQPSCGEEALEITEQLIRSGEISVIAIDSVAALTPRAELEGEMGDAPMALQARLMSQAMRKLVSSVAKTDTILIFLNQIREKIGVMFGSPETVSGGRALKFFSSVRIDVRSSQQIKDGDNIIGTRTKAKVVKNKMARPFLVAESDLIFGKGISIEGDVLDLAIEKGIADKSGAWITIEGQRVQGRAAAVRFLEENPKVLAELKEKL